MPLLLMLFAASIFLGSAFAFDLGPLVATAVVSPPAVAVAAAPPAVDRHELDAEHFSFVIDGKLVLERVTTQAIAHAKPERHGPVDGFFHWQRARVTAPAATVTSRIGQTFTLYDNEQTPACTARVSATLYLYTDERSAESVDEENPPEFDEEPRYLVADLDATRGDCSRGEWARAAYLPVPVFAPHRTLSVEAAAQILTHARRIPTFARARKENLDQHVDFNEEVERYTTSAGDFYAVRGSEPDAACGAFVLTLHDASGRDVSAQDEDWFFVEAFADLDGDGQPELLFTSHGTTLGLMHLERGRFHLVDALAAAPFCPC